MCTPTPPVISTATQEEVRSGVLGLHLRQFNYGFVGEYPESQPVWLNAKDANGELVGGLRAYVFLYWLRIDSLWVAEAARGQKLGTRLLAEAEERARNLGAHSAALETFEWQARGFYVKQGYEEYGRIDDYVKGFYLASMKKKL
ncbi:GNAT superfamily N-acetyltransferase [Variovorax boronicumulans]|uniref:GNAT superfamily N-acetyltransferase n=1 Tax=Variovorax boronicumulans TaxID=436515 RepID=A0AAW8D132_9BURK|nr:MULTISPECIES: GNAT family N-acetyltransferase [Variovorax]MDP9894428.1 GNAT superfamily N-acetyltransferase [Variovorax boronicumulans]MDQ0032966.1 GNAT superfamily N-acetyltransferase [Variovorax boronicumulans]MDQ0054247.1 GNAT superfamily N-acetyltransferase [Variovorax boronicumulans]MDQ0609191.1 GNAT superfamily N-acetyltransferase [Variovorax sp. W1I1]